MAHKDQIQLLQIKTVALGKAAEQNAKELEALQKKANSAPRIRRDLKQKRIEQIAKFYLNRKNKKTA